MMFYYILEHVNIHDIVYSLSTIYSSTLLAMSATALIL